MMTLAQIIFVLFLLTISDLIAIKFEKLYFARKAKKLYKNIDSQVYNLDINNNKKGE